MLVADFGEPTQPHAAGDSECCPTRSSNFSEGKLRDFAGIAAGLKALADPNRLRILDIVAMAPEGEVCVCDLPEPLGLTQPTVSHHLKVLVDAGLLHREKRGVWAYFSLVPGATEMLAASIPRMADSAALGANGNGDPR